MLKAQLTSLSNKLETATRREGEASSRVQASRLVWRKHPEVAKSWSR